MKPHLDGHAEPVVTLVGPPVYRDTTLFTADGTIRLLEGRARVPLSMARKHIRPGWTIEPGVTLENTNEGSTT